MARRSAPQPARSARPTRLLPAPRARRAICRAFPVLPFSAGFPPSHARAFRWPPFRTPLPFVCERRLLGGQRGAVRYNSPEMDGPCGSAGRCADLRVFAESEATMHYITAGESHGPGLTAIVSGVPAGLKVSADQINSDLARRQAGYGRGGRQKIERDVVEVTGGVRFGRTLGSPVSLTVRNRDWENWTGRMAAFGEPPADLEREVSPRPGHADLVGALKNRHRRLPQRPRARERPRDGRARGGRRHCARVSGRTGRGGVLVRGVHRRRGACRGRRASGGARLQAARHRD